MSPRVVLVGPPGAGKSTIGAALARRLSLGFTDSDAVIQDREGSAISDLFIERGEPAFRIIEAATVAELVESSAGVLALGGGAVLADSTREVLRSVPVVFLDTGVAESAARVGMNRDRPLLLGNVRATLTVLMKERRPLYLDVADFVVETDERAPGVIVDDIVRWIEGDEDV